MPRAPKRTKVLKSDVIKWDTFRTFTDVSTLGAIELNKLCKARKIDPKYSKTAKVNLLCLSLGISTSGKENVPPLQVKTVNVEVSAVQRKEFQTLTPDYLVALSDWSKDLSIPDIDETIVKLYLKEARVLTPEMARTYKLSRPFQLKQFVHSMRFHQLPDHPSYVKSNPSFFATACFHK